MKKIISLSKLITLLLFNATVLFLKNPLLVTILLIIMISILLVTRNPVKERLQTILPIAIFILLFQLIFNYSIPIEQRFLFGYISAVRIALISLSVLLFLSFTSLLEIVDLFRFLPKSWLLLLMITCYMIPAILNEADKIKLVQHSRAATLKNRYFFMNITAIIIPLLHRVFQRAEILSLTIVSRGYEEAE